MKKKTWIITVFMLVMLSYSAYGQLRQEYTFQFPGRKFIQPTQICSLMDLIILLQNAQFKLKQGIKPEAVAYFEGEIPSPKLKNVPRNSKPVDVALILMEAIRLFSTKEGMPYTPPPLPQRRIIPADVLVYTSIVFDLLLEHLEKKGLRRIGDYSLLRYRYPVRLKPKD